MNKEQRLPQEVQELKEKCAARWLEHGKRCPCVYRHTDGCPLFRFEQGTCEFSSHPETAAFYAR